MGAGALLSLLQTLYHLVANCPSYNDSMATQSLQHSSPFTTTNRKSHWPVCPQDRRPWTIICWQNGPTLPYRRPTDLVQLTGLIRESPPAPSSHQERWGLLRGLADISRHSKAVFGAPSCGRSQSALPTSLAFASNNSNNYSGTQSRCTRIRGR